MSTFESTAIVGITIPQGELRGARQELEQSLGSVEVSVDGGQAQSGGGGRSTTGLVGGAKALGELSDQTDYLEDILEELEKQGATGGGGGGGGGGLGSTGLGFGLGSVLGGGGGGLLGGILSRLSGFGNLGAAGAAGTALTMPGMLGVREVGEDGEGIATDPITQAITQFANDNSLNLGPQMQEAFGGLFSSGEGMFAGDRSINDIVTGDLSNERWGEPDWLDDMQTTPDWIEGGPDWINDLLGGGGGENEPAQVGSSGNSLVDAMAYEMNDPHLDGRTTSRSQLQGMAYEKSEATRYASDTTVTQAMAYPGGNENRARTRQQEQTRVDATIQNEIQTNLDISNVRELQEFLRNPERYINDKVVGRR